MRKYAIILFVLILVGFDMISKVFFENFFSLGEYFPILNEYLGIQLSHNTGIAFSLPIKGIFLKIITLGILIGLVYFSIKEEYPKNSRLLDVGYVGIIAGALSHTYERIFVGYVIDFISVKYFAILNFADIFISIGALLLFIYYVRYDRKHR